MNDQAGGREAAEGAAVFRQSALNAATDIDLRTALIISRATLAALLKASPELADQVRAELDRLIGAPARSIGFTVTGDE